ncbi:MTFP1 [Lepeophtheirus salmonis]|uniref:Mitochondrial fission process protein 1 n=1 Tax=Lepeophtheirus salmonis TaxID=72036 RepID=A0A0K2T7J0_LEPSM|nr:mitochondrial fission process protein 1-like [Lepeophtheirus salmonis]CAB4063476.1 MTFP1 [Lepeophtheirus salmonis]CAF2923953.1 MTFP1 [Lepeophtheirus salmonis]
MTDKEVDIYRDTPVRLLGYANEVGEAFRALVHVRWVRFSYGISSAYVLADTFDKSIKMNSSLKSSDPEKMKKVAVAAGDTLIWQALASVIVPGFTINRICAFSLMGLEKTLPKIPLSTRKWITTFIGLATIPFIVHPIDTIVHYAMDITTRKYIGGASSSDKDCTD